METQVLNGASFGRIREGLAKNNEAATNAMSEEAASKVVDSGPEANVEPNVVASVEEEAQARRVYARSIPSTLSHAGELISCVTSLGARYRCAYPQFAPAALQAKRIEGYEKIETVGEALAVYKAIVVTRQLAFLGLTTLVSRIISEMVAAGASYRAIRQMRFFARKLEGARAVKKDPNDPDANYNSVSQGTFAQLVENFALIVTMVANDPNYNPEIDDLKVVNLQAKVVELRATNDDSQTKKSALEMSRIERNTFFNEDVTGLVPTFMTAKRVILANFGPRSVEYKQVSGLSFTKIKTR